MTTKEQITAIIYSSDIEIEDSDELANKILSEVTIEVKCPECNGEGETNRFSPNIKFTCDKCRGLKKETITLKEAIERVK